MAVLIAHRWSLGVLRVTLDEAPAVPTVTCEVVINEGSQTKVRLHRQFPIWAFGVSDSVDRFRGRELDLSVPSELVADLASWVHGGADNRAVLWIHLVKPYSVLGAVPWEKMETSIGIPILRLPDLLPDQAPPEGSIDIAVCAAALRRKGDLPLVEVASEILDAAGSLDDARVHFFVDQKIVEQLSDRLGATAGAPVANWTVHEWDPTRGADLGNPPRSGRRTASRADNRWLAWIQDAARKQSFDILHFVCHGYVTGQGDQGVLALPVSPAEADFKSASHVTAADVLNAARKVGAFAVGFSSLPGNYSTSGMRLVADAVGANRAGPVFMYDHRHGEVEQLSYAYKLVLGHAPWEYPEDPSLLFYLQPDLVLVDKARAREDEEYGVSLESSVVADVEASFPSLTRAVTQAAGAANPPPWASVLARYVDEKRSDLTALMAAQQAGTLDSERQAYMEGVEQALKHLDGIVTRHTEGS
jgi:hypothetical protein